METAAPITSEQAWHDWKAACAVRLCPGESAAQLHAFGRSRFALYLQRYASRIGHRGQVLRVAEENDAWHLLETHCQVGQTRAGKKYKDWLFALADQGAATWASRMEAGASLLMRDVVREYLRREHSAAFMEALQKPLQPGGESETFSLEELLPGDTAVFDAVLEREIESLARTMALETVTTVSAREAIAIWVHHQGMALSDPDVLEWAGCGKSVLHDAHHACIERMCRTIRRAYPDEGPSYWIRFACVMLENLPAILLPTFSSEKSASSFFKKKGITVQEKDSQG